MNRHFILTNGRSGSNYFVQLLNQHPETANYGEVLGDWTLPGRHIRPRFRGEDGNARFLDWLYKSGLAFSAGQILSFMARKRMGRAAHFRRRAAVKSLGVKEFTVNLARYGLEDYLAARPDIRLVTLVRSNPLARLLSARQLAKTGAVARLDGQKAPSGGQIVLDLSTLVRDLDVVENENEAVRIFASRHEGPVFRLEYEAFFASDRDRRDEILAELQAFLGASPMKLQSEHRRLRRSRLDEAISNFAEVREVLLGSRFERWLDDQPRQNDPASSTRQKSLPEGGAAIDPPDSRR